MKCYDCICGIELPEGVWCIKYKCIPSEEIINNCRSFADKRKCNPKEMMSDGDET